MVGMADVTSVFVNGAQLANFIGQRVSIIGLVSEERPGVSFTLQSTDNVNVTVKMKKPFAEAINGYVQVIGTSQGRSIIGDELCTFKNETFDAKNYNALCVLLNSHADLFVTKT